LTCTATDYPIVFWRSLNTIARIKKPTRCLASCAMLCGRETIFCIRHLPLNINAKHQLNLRVVMLLASCILLGKQFDRFSMLRLLLAHSINWRSTSTLHSAHQFHTLFGTKIEIKMPTCIQLNASRCDEPNSNYRLQPILCVDLNAHIALDSAQSKFLEFNLNGTKITN